MTSQRSDGAAPRIAPVRGRLFPPLVLVAVAGLSLGLAGCGSSSPSGSYQEGWDRVCQLPTVRLQHRPAGHRISLRLDKGLYDCGEFPEDPYRKRATDPNSDHILQRSVAFDSFHGTYGSGFG